MPTNRIRNGRVALIEKPKVVVGKFHQDLPVAIWKLVVVHLLLGGLVILCKTEIHVPVELNPMKH